MHDENRIVGNVVCETYTVSSTGERVQTIERVTKNVPAARASGYGQYRSAITIANGKKQANSRNRRIFMHFFLLFDAVATLFSSCSICLRPAPFTVDCGRENIKRRGKHCKWCRKHTNAGVYIRLVERPQESLSIFPGSQGGNRVAPPPSPTSMSIRRNFHLFYFLSSFSTLCNIICCMWAIELKSIVKMIDFFLNLQSNEILCLKFWICIVNF